MTNVAFLKYNNPLTSSKAIDYLEDDVKVDSYTLPNLSKVDAYPPKSLDQNIHDQIIQFFKDNQYDIIFIPLSLTYDYTNFTGILFGLHLRLTNSIGKNQLAKIVFYGEESKEDICALNSIGYFLFSKNVCLIKESKAEVKKAIDQPIKLLNRSELTKIAKSIIIDPPAFYDNKHAVTNEWGLLYLDTISGHHALKGSEKLNEIRANLFIKKELINAGIIEEKTSTSTIIHKKVQKKRFLLIDDEWNKGWLKFLTSIFPKSNILDKVAITKGDTIEDINKGLENKLKQDWDVIFLDIRLIDKDHKKGLPYEEYSGFKILENILKSNEGHRVVLMSASNKHWIYEYGIKKGASFAISKPSIEFHNKFLLEEKFAEKILIFCEHGGFLKKVQSKLPQIKKLAANLKLPKNENDSINKKLDIGFELCKNATPKNQEYYKYIYLQFFSYLETLVNKCFLISENKEGEVTYDIMYADNKIIYARQDTSKEDSVIIAVKFEDSQWRIGTSSKSKDNILNTHFKVSALLLFFFGFTTSKDKHNFGNWYTINNLRNKAAHPSKVDINETHLFNLLSFISFILNPKNLNSRNLAKGLPTSKIDMLKEHFGS